MGESALTLESGIFACRVGGRPGGKSAAVGVSGYVLIGKTDLFLLDPESHVRN